MKLENEKPLNDKNLSHVICQVMESLMKFEKKQNQIEAENFKENIHM
jgi:hypothetical protein